MCACAQRTGTALRKSLRRDRSGRLTSPAFHASGSASPVNTRFSRSHQHKYCHFRLCVLCSRFPPTAIVVGGMDPLLDDSIEFVSRLRRLSVNVQLHVFRSLPHGFLGASFLPVAQPAVELLRTWACAPFIA